MDSKKLLKLFLILAVILIIAGPLLGFFLDKVTIESREASNPLIIQESSTTTIRDAYHKDITLSRNQMIIIEFSVYYPDVSADLIILGKGTYDQEFAADNPPPGSGLTFLYSEFTYGQPATYSSSPATVVTISNDGYWYIEFAGGYSGVGGDYLISRPGNYVVVVYGNNVGPGTEVTFNLTVKVDGPGDFLEELFLTIGILLLACCAIFYAYSYLNKLRRGM